MLAGGQGPQDPHTSPWGAFKHMDSQFPKVPQFTMGKRSGKRAESHSHHEVEGEEERGQGSTQKVGRLTAEFQAPRWKE